MMEWLESFLVRYPELSLYLVIALGYWIGTLKFGSFSLGPVTGALFAGILVGQFALYATLLWLLAWAITRVAGRRSLPVAIAIVVALLAVALVRPIYRCPFLPDVSRVSLLGVYR